MKSPTQSVIFHLAEDSVDKMNVGQMTKDVKCEHTHKKKKPAGRQSRASADGRLDGGRIIQFNSGYKRTKRRAYTHLSVKHSKVPLTWKTVIVIPVSKAGHKTKPVGVNAGGNGGIAPVQLFCL